MPSYIKKGNTYISTLQCGAGMDAYLQIELSENEVEETKYIELKPMKNGLSDGVDPERIKEWVIKGVESAFEITGKKFHIKQIGYIPNDSKHYELHGRIVCQVLERIHSGGEFHE